CARHYYGYPWFAYW
nr:immunoglobulin heavy chain junction region [Mus musculus]